MDLIIGLIAIVLVAYYIVKGYSATGVLMFGGLVLLFISVLMGHSILPEGVKSTSSTYFDILEYVKYLLGNRGGGLGLMIMVLCGFSVYMTHLGANDVVVKLVSKPLKNIRSPYILMVFAYFLACLMSFAVASATGLGVLLMATLFPVMVNVGISRGAAAAICASPISIILSPTSGDVVLSAEISKIPLGEFAFGTALPVSIFAILGIAVAHFFWQRYLDKKEGVQVERLNADEIKTTAPNYYAILPLLPIIGVLLFDGKWGLPNLHIVTVMVLCFIITAVVDFLRSFNAKQTFDNLVVAYRGMADAFAGVVMLLVAAGVFAQSLSTIGFITNLIDSAQSFGGSAFFMMLVLAVITILATMATGSGNAAFYAFAELIPKLATQMGVNPAFLTIPMLQASNLGRGLSPVSGVVVAVSGMGKISPFEIVKRMSVPMLVGFICVIIGTEIFVSVAA
ncbi:MAG: anaerobic C4-dicarboxylate transporter DcuC [Haemophilus parainfluenzae]|jgi:transporter, anaerobic C4-dicarboxylate uptake C (dcuC) family|uniref:anaerobic C4-dicarboxylate transporter DcuC n=1 Tax=Haemophilus parainfluenzae TaxID=729 RepID=UPI00066A640A|nr:anaerobic C4-dicarboxylate transporter DcuC [Haemophilus parainfluenzae]MDU2561937.1 anaerobic C4-dicarboxylate transporter DcuC [Haemophilus parainfluenzae]MDU4440605.1 anaerobic C4-dicarboxylate transporter DcuC [Haemophilus parainfluenzae]MDU4497996.1 anaerobic C4-dicarboxylate transporter DcuC [Haemophilus parainfluenzae]